MNSNEKNQEEEEEEKKSFKEEDWNETFKEMYIYEILEGKPEYNFKGIYPIIEDYLAGIECPNE